MSLTGLNDVLHHDDLPAAHSESWHEGDKLAAAWGRARYLVFNRVDVTKTLMKALMVVLVYDTGDAGTVKGLTLRCYFNR